MTWEELKIACLQKMFLIENNELVLDDNVTAYVNAMPHATNEALQRLSTAGKFIIKHRQISQMPMENALRSDFSIKRHLSEDVAYEANGAKSYYFEVDNIADIYIEKYTGGAWAPIITINNSPSVPGEYTVYKGLIDNVDSNIRIRFSGLYPYNYRHVAFYPYTFHSKEAVPNYIPEVRYNLREIIDDYYLLKNVIKENYGRSGYENTSDYHFEGDSIFIIPYEAEGSYTIYYYAYPAKITKDTPDNYVFPLDPDVQVLIPLYVASQLYADDDIALATKWRNEFEVGLSALDATINAGTTEFTSVIGY